MNIIIILRVLFLLIIHELFYIMCLMRVDECLENVFQMMKQKLEMNGIEELYFILSQAIRENIIS